MEPQHSHFKYVRKSFSRPLGRSSRFRGGSFLGVAFPISGSWFPFHDMGLFGSHLLMKDDFPKTCFQHDIYIYIKCVPYSFQVSNFSIFLGVCYRHFVSICRESPQPEIACRQKISRTKCGTSCSSMGRGTRALLFWSSL